jgi:hypothetical protein
MSERNWDKELSKIDKQLESISDEALFPTKSAPTPTAKASTAAVQQGTRTWGAFARLTLAVLLGVAMLFWPYSARCGAGLAAYLGAVAAVVGGGVWSAVWTWRHRTARAHTLSLLLVLWGLVLAALEVLPRVGYAKPDMNHPAIWSCE